MTQLLWLLVCGGGIGAAWGQPYSATWQHEGFGSDHTVAVRGRRISEIYSFGDPWREASPPRHGRFRVHTNEFGTRLVATFPAAEGRPRNVMSWWVVPHDGYEYLVPDYATYTHCAKLRSGPQPHEPREHPRREITADAPPLASRSPAWVADCTAFVEREWAATVFAAHGELDATAAFVAVKQAGLQRGVEGWVCADQGSADDPPWFLVFDVSDHWYPNKVSALVMIFPALPVGAQLTLALDWERCALTE